MTKNFKVTFEIQMSFLSDRHKNRQELCLQESQGQ